MFACIFIPDFSAQALIRFEPELRARPVAVLTGRPPLEKVVALNERARQRGVEAGTTKSQLEAWENLVLRARSEPQETSAHAALLDCAQSFSPEVEDTSPGTVLLNLAGLEPLLGSLPKIARDLAQRVSQMGLEANFAVAANPDAALLAARGFSGVTLIPEGREAERLGDLPVDVLLESFSSDAEEAARWVETFDRWGIRKLRVLAALPGVPVSERLGQHGIRLQKLARGAVSRNLRVWEPQLIFAESVELEYPIVLLEPLAFLLNRMLEQVCARTRNDAAARLRIIHPNGRQHSYSDVHPHAAAAHAHAGRESVSQIVAAGFAGASARSTHREDSFVGGPGAAASAAEWIVSAGFSRARKTGTDAGAHRRDCRRRKSGVGGVTGYTSRRRVYSAALRARRACARSARAGKAQSEAAGKSEGGYVHVRKWQRLSSR
jgi:protein ImuB